MQTRAGCSCLCEIGHNNGNEVVYQRHGTVMTREITASTTFIQQSTIHTQHTHTQTHTQACLERKRDTTHRHGVTDINEGHARTGTYGGRYIKRSVSSFARCSFARSFQCGLAQHPVGAVFDFSVVDVVYLGYGSQFASFFSVRVFSFVLLFGLCGFCGWELFRIRTQCVLRSSAIHDDDADNDDDDDDARWPGWRISPPFTFPGKGFFLFVI